MAEKQEVSPMTPIQKVKPHEEAPKPKHQLPVFQQTPQKKPEETIGQKIEHAVESIKSLFNLTDGMK